MVASGRYEIRTDIVPVEEHGERADEGRAVSFGSIVLRRRLLVVEGDSRKTQEVGRGGERHDGARARNYVLDQKPRVNWIWLERMILLL